MAYTSGFFDAVDQGGGNYDRVYSAATFAHYFSLLVKNGVFPDPSTGMQVKASSNPDMHVSVQPGSGWVNGYYITVEDNAPEQLTIPTANPSLSRIDSVIMGLNYVDREIQLYIKSGAVSASPSAVSLQRDNDLYELELAQITVGAGVASISQSSIVDMRQNTPRCGIVAGTINQIDTTDLFAQYDDAFQTWFEGIKTQLSGDIATNLQNQINTLKTEKVAVSDKATKTQAQAGTSNDKWMSPAMVKAYMDFILATTSEAQAGSVDTKWMSPAKVKAFYNYMKATASEASNGTNDTKWVSPAKVKSMVKPFAYDVGDTIETFRTNLGANWLLCNGEGFDPDTYPKLAAITPEFESLYPFNYQVLNLGTTASGYAEGNGYQVLVTVESTGVFVRYSTDHFKTINSVFVYSNRDARYANVFFANGYFIMVCTTNSGYPGAPVVYYTQNPANWTAGTAQGYDFYGSGFGKFFDLWYSDGNYYLACAGTNEANTGRTYPYMMKSPSPSFLKTAGATVTQLSSKAGYIEGFYRDNNTLAFISNSGSEHAVMYSTPSAPLAYTYKAVTISGNYSGSYLSRSCLSLIDGKFVYVGYYRSDNSYYYPILVYSDSITADSWTGQILNLPVSTESALPKSPIFKIREKFYLFGEYPLGKSSNSFLCVSNNLLGPYDWKRILTQDNNSVLDGALNYDLYPSIKDNTLRMYVGTYVVTIPLYSVPKSNNSSLYKYIKAKEGV